MLTIWLYMSLCCPGQLREADAERSIAERRVLVDSLASREDFATRLEQQLTALATARYAILLSPCFGRRRECG